MWIACSGFLDKTKALLKQTEILFKRSQKNRAIYMKFFTALDFPARPIEMALC